MSDAGIIILPHSHVSDEGELMEDGDLLEPEPGPLKWPTKPGIPQSDFFDPEDSLYDPPPEGFGLSVSFILFKPRTYQFLFHYFLFIFDCIQPLMSFSCLLLRQCGWLSLHG